MAKWLADPRYTRLIQQRNAELIKVALLISGDRHDAEDAVQDAIISVSKAWIRVTERGAYAYSRAAVVRSALATRKPLTRDIDLFDGAVDDENFLKLEQDRQFSELLLNLPPQQRTVLVLR